jgi:folate-dependent phosphoribosylglycinamide formyltransferase PurN
MTNSKQRKQRWVALFSQTGSEIVAISKVLNRYPDYIFTNKKEDSSTKTVEELVSLLDKDTNTPLVRKLPEFKQNEFDYEKVFQESDLITLHGYLRIIPASICQRFEIYNGHPGLITMYPDLKGKDPQEKAFSKSLKVVGSIVHRCTAELDNGPVYTAISKSINSSSTLRETYYNTLKETSIEAWISFFKGNYPDLFN